MDRAIELKAAKLSGILLAVLVMSWCLVAMVWALTVGVKAASAVEAGAGLVIPLRQALIGVHLLFAGFVVANVVYYALIVASYRRLADG